MDTFERWFTQDLNKPILPQHGQGLVFTGDDGTPLVGVHVTRNGAPADLSGTVSCTVIRADGTTVPVTGGTISGGDVSVVLSSACFNIRGPIGVALAVTSGSTTMTVLKAVFQVDITSTGNIIDPSGEITLDVANLIADIDAAVASIPADYSDLLAAIAQTFSASTAYAAGAYAWNNGKLYRFTAAHAAGAWIGTDAAQVSLAGDVADLKSAIGTLGITIAQMDISQYSTVYGTIQSTGQWGSIVIGGTYKSAVITDIPKTMTVTAKTDYNAYVSLLSSVITQPTSTTDPVPFCSGETGRHTITAGNTEDITVPSDCKCIVVTVLNNGLDYTPIIKGFFSDYDLAEMEARITDAEEQIESINEEIGAINEEIGAINEEIGEIAEKTEYTSKNLFNPNAAGVLVGYYLATNGTPTELSGWNTSDYIDVSTLTSIVASVWEADETYFTYGKLNYLHTYNAQKQHIAKVWDASTNGVYTVEDGVAFIRFCWQPGNELASGRKLMVESGTTHSAEYEAWFAPYEETTLKPEVIGDGSIEEEKLSSEVQEKLNIITPENNPDIVFWGDSLTYSQGASENSNRYPYLVGQLANKATYNWGMPGANSMDISGLQGGMPIYLDPFTLPAGTTQVTVTLRDANGDSNYIGLLHHMPRAGWVNDIQAMNNTWLIDGIPVMLIYSAGVMKLYRLSAGDSENIFTRPVKLTSVQNYSKKQIQVFFVGTNDAPSTQEKAERTVRIVKQMVDFYGGNRYLVLGMTVKAYADASNAIFAQTFGNHYVDVKDYLIRYGLDDNNLTPTEQDTTDIAGSVVPTSLRTDSVHFNDYGYVAIANCVYRHGKDLGYWD